MSLSWAVLGAPKEEWYPPLHGIYRVENSPRTNGLAYFASAPVTEKRFNEPHLIGCFSYHSRVEGPLELHLRKADLLLVDVNLHRTIRHEFNTRVPKLKFPVYT